MRKTLSLVEKRLKYGFPDFVGKNVTSRRMDTLLAMGLAPSNRICFEFKQKIYMEKIRFNVAHNEKPCTFLCGFTAATNGISASGYIDQRPGHGRRVCFWSFVAFFSEILLTSLSIVSTKSGSRQKKNRFFGSCLAGRFIRFLPWAVATPRQRLKTLRFRSLISRWAEKTVDLS